jgi:F0F1-type ATP synthase membrane subunit b/b'
MAKKLRLGKMAKSETPTQKDEFSRIFDEYRAKIEEISRKTRSETEADESDGAVSEDAENLEVTVSRLQPKRAIKSADLISLADMEAEETIMAAKRRAQQIIDEAEEKSKKEAGKKTQSQVEKIIVKAKKDAEDMIAQVREATEKESNEIVAAAKQETEQLIREITEKCRRETQEQSNRAIDRARGKADQMMTEIIVCCQGISLMASEIITRARQTIDEFEAKLQNDIGDLAKAIAEAQQKLQEYNKIAQKEKDEVGLVPINKNLEPPEAPKLAVRVLGTKSNGHDDTQPLFSGQVEMKSISSTFDFQYLKNLKRYMVHIPNINYVQEYSSEKETSIVFELTEPLPLLEILRNIPMVDEVDADNDEIKIVFKGP